jgi:hypothetical protein
VRTLGTILLVSLMAFGLVSVAIGTVPEPGHSASVVWSGQNFTSQNDLNRWLEARGGSYKTWARRHPSQASVLESPASAVATQTTTHRRYLLRGALAIATALLLLFAFMSPRRRYRRVATATRQLLPRERLKPTFAAVGATAAFAVQARSASSPHLRSLVDAGRQSLMDMHDALSTPHRRRTVRIVLLYAAYVIFAIALGAAVAIHFSNG